MLGEAFVKEAEEHCSNVDLKLPQILIYLTCSMSFGKRNAKFTSVKITNNKWTPQNQK
jgi:hypothetical protein